MKSKNVFKGTIKKCEDFYSYMKYGEERYVGDFKVGKIEVGTTYKYANIIDEEAILLKMSDKKFVWLDLVNTKAEEILVNLGIACNAISTSPICNNDIFVDEETLEPYFKAEDKKLSVKKIKSLVSNSKR